MYCDYQDQGQQTSENILGSLLQQLARQISPLPMALLDLYKKCRLREGPPKEEMERLLLDVCREFGRCFIIVDALDECEAQTSRKAFLKSLKALSSRASLFITSRPHLQDIEQSLSTFSRISIQAQESDIRKYLTLTIQEDSCAADLIDESLRDEIVQHLTQGMSVSR